MHLTCTGASKFTPEGQLRLQLASFLRTKQVRIDSGGRGALAKFLEKFAKSEVFVGVAHFTEQ